MNLDMDGKAIGAIFFPGDNGSIMRATGTLTLTMSATYHGDRDEFWVVQSETIDGVVREVARHNARHIETIQWVR